MSRMRVGGSGEAVPGLVTLADRCYGWVQEGGWGRSNCGYVAGERLTLVFDSLITRARTESAFRAFLAKEPPNSVILVNSHHHKDHTYGNCVYSPTITISSASCRARVVRDGFAGQEDYPEVDFGDLTLEPASLTFPENLTLNILANGEEVQLLALGNAHTEGDISCWIPSRRVLLAGDTVMNRHTPLFQGGSPDGLRRALTALVALKPMVVLPGHGPTAGPDVIRANLAYVDFVLDYCTSAAHAGLPPREAALRCPLGPYRTWGERERIVGNVYRTYAELGYGEPDLSRAAVHRDTIAYNQGLNYRPRFL